MASVNPLRYRGYYFDSETGFYYLMSRYYDPEIGRFINADGLVATGQGLLGNNMFAYCNNNPVNNSDPTGELLAAMFGGLIAGAVIGAISNLVSSGLSGEPIDPKKVATSALVGGITGALGAVAGVIESARGAYSVAVGVISAINTTITTEGSTEEKVYQGLKSGAIAMTATYLGAGIPTLTNCGKFAEGFTAFAGALFSGTQAEIINVATS